jgi:hypothetical protein
MTTLKYTNVSANVYSEGQKNIRFVQSGYTLFFNAQHSMIQLTPHERAFYDYLCENMDVPDNLITIDTEFKERFIAHIQNLTSNENSPTLKVVTNYRRKLIKIGLLILMGSPKSDFYCVNPKYAFKGSGKQRTNALKKLIEERSRNGLPINMLINQSTEENEK